MYVELLNKEMNKKLFKLLLFDMTAERPCN